MKATKTSAGYEYKGHTIRHMARGIWRVKSDEFNEKLHGSYRAAKEWIDKATEPKETQDMRTEISFWHYQGMRIDDESYGESSIYHRITLEKGEQYQDFLHELNDEGYSKKYIEYTFNGMTLTLVDSSEGRDCDGRHSTTRTLLCTADQVEARAPNLDGIRLPEWDLVSSEQRDHNAEMAGY